MIEVWGILATFVGVAGVGFWIYRKIRQIERHAWEKASLRAKVLLEEERAKLLQRLAESDARHRDEIIAIREKIRRGDIGGAFGDVGVRLEDGGRRD